MSRSFATLIIKKKNKMKIKKEILKIDLITILGRDYTRIREHEAYRRAFELMQLIHPSLK